MNIVPLLYIVMLFCYLLIINCFLKLQKHFDGWNLKFNKESYDLHITKLPCKIKQIISARKMLLYNMYLPAFIDIRNKQKLRLTLKC